MDDQEAQPVEKAPSPTDEGLVLTPSTEKFLDRGVFFRKIFEWWKEEGINHWLVDFDVHSKVRDFIEDVANNKDTQMARLARGLLEKRKVGYFTKLITWEDRLIFEAEHREFSYSHTAVDVFGRIKLCPFCPPSGSFVDDQVRLMAQIRFRGARPEEKGGESKMIDLENMRRFDEYVPSYNIGELGGLDSVIDVAKDLYKKRRPKLERLICQLGFSQEETTAMMVDGDFGAKLLAVCAVVETAQKLKTTGFCTPEAGDVLAVQDLKNIGLLQDVIGKAWKSLSDKEKTLIRAWSLRSHIVKPIRFFAEKAVGFKTKLSRGMRSIAGQDVIMESGQPTILKGPNNCGKTTLMQGLGRSLADHAILRFPFFAKRAIVPERITHLCVTAPITRTERGSGLAKELEQIKTQFDEVRQGRQTKPVFIFDDFGGTTDVRTQLSLGFSFLDYIYKNWPDAYVLLNCQAADEISRFCDQEAVGFSPSFIQLGENHKVVRFNRGESFENLEAVAMAAIKKGEEAAIEDVRGRIFGRTDFRTLQTFLDGERLAELLTHGFFSGTERTDRLQVTEQFYNHLTQATQEDLEVWAAVAPLEAEEISRLMGRNLTPDMSREIDEFYHRGKGLLDHKLGDRAAYHPVSAFLNELEYYRNVLIQEVARQTDLSDLKRAILIKLQAGFSMAAFCRHFGQEKKLNEFGARRLDVRQEGSELAMVNPALDIILARLHEQDASIDRAKTVRVPQAFFTDRNRVKIWMGPNKGGKSETGMTIGIHNVLLRGEPALGSPETAQLGYDYVLSVSQDKLTVKEKEAGGELARFMMQVGEVKNRIKMMEVMGGKRGLIILDEPDRGVDPAFRHEINTMVAKELTDLSSDIEILLITHCDHERLQDSLDRQNLSHSTWYVPSSFSTDPELKPYCLYPANKALLNKNQNSLLVRDVLGEEIGAGFDSYYQQLFEDRESSEKKPGLS